MYNKTKNSFLSKRSLNIGIAFVVVALVAGVYFLFRPFPAGSSLEVKAEVPFAPAGKAAASVAGSYANHSFSLQDAASVVGWSAYANPSGIAQAAESQLASSFASSSASVQRLDIGAGYVLENDQQGSRIVAPSAPSVSSFAVQRLDIGSGYVLELNQAGGRIIAPVKLASAAPASSVQRLDIGAGYVLETTSQGTRIVAPTALLKGSTTGSNAEAITKIDIGSGYTLVLGPGSQGEIVPAP